jgi:YYY domain-containing protein
MRPPLLFRWALAGDSLPDRRARGARLWPLAALVPGTLILGGLYFLNSWDFPAYFALAQAAALAGAWWVRRDRDEPRESWAKALGVVVGCGALAILLYLPFHLTFKPPVLSDTASPLPIGIVTQRSYLSQFLEFWGIQLLLLIPVLTATLAWRGGGSVLPALTGSLRRAGSAALIAREAPGWELAITGVVVLALIALADRLGSGALMCSLALAAGGAYGARRALVTATTTGRADPLAGRRPLAFAFGAICLAGLLLAACEVIYIRDFYGGSLRRMNTVFKFYYQAWLLLAVGGPVASFWLYRTLRARAASSAARGARWALLSLGALLMVAGLHFPLRVAWLRTEGFTVPPTLNGMEWMRRFHPEDYAAAEWLRTKAPTPAEAAPVVLEATGGAYSEFARIATQTGLPTVLGWDQHERLWRGAQINQEVDRRKADVDAAYTSATFEQAKPILDKYGVGYIVVGYLEQQKYGSGGGLAKFEAAARDGTVQRVFAQGATAVYRVKR